MAFTLEATLLLLSITAEKSQRLRLKKALHGRLHRPLRREN
jgi:hypothetical protein